MPIRLLDGRISEFGAWTGPASTHCRILLETLADNLTPTISSLHAGSVDELERQFDDVAADVERRWAAKQTLDRIGSHGTIDALALNAIRQQVELAPFMATLRGRCRAWLPDETALIWQDGHISSGGDPLNPKFDWTGNRFTIWNATLPEASKIAAIGRPASSVFPHPPFSPEIVVEDVTDGVDDQDHSCLNLLLAMPSFHFTVEDGSVDLRPV
ncbi:hypothetical protein [Sphingomonas sp. BAUL-RG-20F-R05-02]|uniref:hypothetical protein n=1 Tax=Sphingomonas sp. BAUL-RG-20F-R05-02 TaxID=2914830 RepID=UPI001F58EA42|nr:hypothetical protein [Sphingomonas sp. BAUL-RG-20F-R05-02]